MFTFQQLLSLLRHHIFLSSHRLSVRPCLAFSFPALSAWRWHMLLIHQLVWAAAAACGADVAPLNPKRGDTIESASVITAELIGV